jgi:two-component system response regulator
MRILLIEDDDLQARILVELLTQQGSQIHVERVADGDEALSRLPAGGGAEEPPQLVVLDLGLERIDGLDFLIELRSMPRYRGLPVVVLSGSADADKVRGAYESGANSYLEKPRDSRELGPLIELIVNYWGRANVT